MKMKDKTVEVVDNLCSYIKYSILDGIEKGELPIAKQVVNVLDELDEKSQYTHSLVYIENTLFKKFINETCDCVVKQANNN